MAISLKQGSGMLNGLAALKKAGVPEAQGAWLIDAGYSVQLTANAFLFISDEGETVSSVPVSLETLQKLNAGTLAEAGRITLLQSLVGAITLLPGTGKPDLKGALDLLPKSVAKGKPAAATPASAWAFFDAKKMSTAAPVKLRDATQMYQPVLGTSKNSRYFVVGGSADVRIAAKYGGHKLSVRIEGPNLDAHLPAVKKAGFGNADAGNGYASLHLNVPDDIVAAKALGAVLLGLGIPLDSPFPNINLIKGKG